MTAITEVDKTHPTVDYTNKRFKPLTNEDRVKGDSYSVYDSVKQKVCIPDLKNIWQARIRADALNHKHYCTLEAKEGEMFLWNIKKKDWPDPKFAALKTIRAGVQAYDINGTPLTEADEMLPIFIHKSEEHVVDAIMMQKTFPGKRYNKFA
jgi:hypothetical protein